VITGAEQLLQETAVAIEAFEDVGFVRIRGELWRAIARAPVREGQRLRVTHVKGLTVEVAPLE
jgi:membrane-bound serine protease (ClpP class)